MKNDNLSIEVVTPGMIGVFDSGIGGLSVVKALWRYLPDYQIVYFGDTARFPYGTKGVEVIKRYAYENAQFLIEQGAQIIVIACNTASAVALDYLSQKLPVPVLGVIEAGAIRAAELTKNNKIAIIGTRATIQSRVYENKLKKIDAGFKVYSQACPLLVSLVEEGWLKYPESRLVLKRYLAPLKKQKIDTLVLGCTHYPLAKNAIQQVVGSRVKLVDSGEALAVHLARFLKEEGLVGKIKKGSKHQFFVSDLTPNLEAISQKWLNKKIKWQLSK